MLAAGTLGVQVASTAPGAATSASSGSATERPTGLASAAIAALQRHPGAARASDGQGFTATHTMVDRDGTTHVRLERTVHGIAVLGGDAVVHRGPHAGWEGVSQTLTAPLTLSVRPALGAAAATTQALSPARATRSIADLRSAGTPRLVVDATSGRPRLAYEVMTTAPGPTGRRAGSRRTSTQQPVP